MNNYWALGLFIFGCADEIVYSENDCSKAKVEEIADYTKTCGIKVLSERFISGTDANRLCSQLAEELFCTKRKFTVHSTLAGRQKVYLE